MTDKQTTIGASEFAATLNGDDPHEILRVLKLFAKSVQKERQLALFDEQDESDSDSSDDDDEGDVEERPAKKLKKDEQWKEDSASYHVPFVGTAVSRSDVSEVVAGQWPTGLLEAYLNKSPLAIELMSDDISSSEGKIHRSLLRKKHMKTSRAIKKAYLNAVAQLLTAVIPIRKLRQQNSEDMYNSSAEEDSDVAVVDVSSDAKYGKFLPALLKKRLPECINVLNEETSSGRGKTGVLGGCGNLAVPALKLIQNIVFASTANARLVAKYLDEELHHGVLRCLLRPLPPKVNSKSEKVASSSDISRRLEARTETMELANFLLKMQDTVVNTYICTSGSKERKVKPGILFVALREGLLPGKAKSQSPNDIDNDGDATDYMDAVADLLKSFRLLILNQPKSMNSRLLSELLSGEPIQNLCFLLTHAPRLSGKNTYLSIVNEKDTYGGDIESLPNVGLEARRIVFPLLYDSSRSPYLSASKHGKLDAQHLGKILLSLLWTPSGGIGMQKFLIACAQKTPALLPILFRLLTFPDPKHAYDFVATAHFVSALLLQGPSVEDCLTGEEGSNVQEILLALFPEKFKKQALTKAMQSKNSLVVMGCIMLFSNVLKRLEKLRADASKSLKWSDDFIQEATDTTLQLFPDIQVLLKIRMSFDAFSRSKESAIVNERLFQVIILIVKVSPTSVQTAGFDWMKLVPNDTNRFFKAVPFVQRSLLRTLRHVIKVWDAFKNVLEIMLHTKEGSVYKDSRVIAINLLVRMLQSRWTDENSESFIRYESECWINGLTIDSLPSFCALLRDVTENELQIVATIGDVWSRCKAVGPMTCSLLLFAAWATEKPLAAFAKLFSQVSLRVMLFHRSPLVVANLIHFADKESSWSEGESVPEFTKDLVHYASMLRHFDGVDGTVERKTLGKIFNSLVGKGDIITMALTWVHSKSSITLESFLNEIESDRLTEDASALARFLIHVNIISDEGSEAAIRCWTLLLNIAVKILSGSDPNDYKNDIIHDISLCCPDDNRLPLLVASCPIGTCDDYTHSGFCKLTEVLTSADSNASSKDRRVCICKFLLLWDTIPMSFVARSQLQIIDSCDRTSERSAETSIGFALEFLKRTNSIWETASCNVNVVRSLFLKWWALVSVGGSDSSLIGFRTQTCLALTSVLENCDSLSAIVVALIQSKPLDDFVLRCLSSDVPSGTGLLAAAVRNDPFLLSPKVLQNIDIVNLNDKVTTKGQELDSLVMVIVRRSIDSLSKENLQMLYEKVFERVKLSLSNVVVGDQKLADTLSTIKVCGALLQSSGERMSVIVPEVIFQHIVTILKIEKSRWHPGVFSLCSMAIAIVKNADTQQRLELKAILYLRLSEWIALGFKEEFRIKDPKESCLTSFLLLLQDVQSSDLDALKRGNTALTLKIVRSCLKYGIGLAEQSPAQSSLSLELVKTLLERIGDPKSHHSALDFLGAPISSIFDLLKSHSKFREVLSSSSPELDIVKLELVRLMVCCIRLSPQGVTIDAGMWTSVFAAFDCGLSELDIEIRKLFMACCDLQGEEIQVPYMDEFRWKSCVESGKSDKVNWDWLAEALDPVRLRATVSQFPVHDTVDMCSEDIGSSVTEGDSDSQNSDSEMSVDQDSVSSGQTAVAAEVNRRVEWTRDHTDLRYSPAFLLPLVLGALESTLPNKETKAAEIEATVDALSDSLKDSGRSQLNRLVRMVQKLCDAGVHSLCLAALASTCNKVRQCSSAILSVLLLGCNSEESRSLSSWRNRPQVSMVLNSIQLAFVIKKATNKLNGVNFGVQPLSPLVSTFLARASYSVCKPDDALFVPLNRFFLKNEKDHGAFQDMNRLPGFISLFCSAAEDPTQSRQERMWALQLVRDGFRDSSCYRLIAECHAPELILTSFENLRLSQLPDAMKDAEYALMMTVFKKMFSMGSSRVMNHLVSRIGVLSWMRSWCTTWTVQESFPRVNSRIAMCELVGCIAEQSFLNEPPRTDSFLYELCALAEPMIILGARTKKTDEGFATLIETICNAVKSIKRSVLKHKEAFSFSDIQPLGLSIKRSLDFWKVLDGDVLARAVVALSAVPLRLDQPTEEERESLISILLRSCLQCVDSGTDDQVVLMNRLLLAQKQFGAPSMANTDTIRNLLTVRPTFVTSKHRLVLFNACLRGTVSENELSCREHEIALALLEAAPEF
ncbi:unnamed protein product [Cylindrotheca closterium]|uniref:URB1 C-terminal domain-containing protein n=1 Tax=Cylindrotheca closterium TaxID=2856 RepID=A0AAD2CLE9_9STRA|nr:unnamed protein product [Cylindrotheca closterium]